MERKRPRMAVWKFASCDGCQLSLLDLEDELLSLADAVDIAYFREATSRESEGPFDLSLVDGSITTPDDVQRIQEVRRRSTFLVVLGACATTGGIQALRNFGDIEEFKWGLEQVARGRIRPVLDREFALADAAAAHERVGSNAALGNVVLVND